MPDNSKILVIDDDNIQHFLVENHLNEIYTVICTNNGRDGLTIARSEKIDLILLDIGMPEMNGLEVCRELKRTGETSEIPVIFLTVKDDIDSQVKGLKQGAVDYITKPFSPEILRARVKTHLTLSSQRKRLKSLADERLEELLETQREIINRLGQAAEFRDEETGDHIQRMSQYSFLLARAYGMNQEEAILLKHAASMHDLGKIGIPDHILLKPARLTEAEFNIMKRHTKIGEKIIGNKDIKLLEFARIIAKTHHEKWNGTGYPRGLSGNQIPIEGRIVSIADVFDALTSERPYKKAWTKQEALDEIKKNRGIQFDPDLVDLFLTLPLDTIYRGI
ncbi:MAG: response regulator [Magnetococcales bacterium]|nr:response regulator [Magnetococcales bacterium]